MDTLQTAYKILYSLEHKEKGEYMGAVLGPEKIGAEPEKWLEVMQSLVDEGYVAGVRIYTDITGEQVVDLKNARITLKGAEYLHENSAMKKLAKIATDVITIIKP